MANLMGERLGNYRLIRLLGEGGFAEVYLAEHIHLGTQAAIKVLLTQLAKDTMEQFRTEARTIARLEHVDMSQSAVASHPTSTASLQQGFALTGGGGAEVHWTGAGNLLWQLEPVALEHQETQQFIASSKDHDISDPAAITTYALGIQIA